MIWDALSLHVLIRRSLWVRSKPLHYIPQNQRFMRTDRATLWFTVFTAGCRKVKGSEDWWNLVAWTLSVIDTKAFFLKQNGKDGEDLNFCVLHKRIIKIWCWNDFWPLDSYTTVHLKTNPRSSCAYCIYLFLSVVKRVTMRGWATWQDTLSNLASLTKEVPVIKLHKSQYWVAIATGEGVREYPAYVLAEDFTSIMFSACTFYSNILIFRFNQLYSDHFLTLFTWNTVIHKY